MAHREPHSPTRGLVSILLAVVLLTFAVPRIADYGQAWRHVRGMDAVAIAALATAAAGNLVTYWILLVVALPGLTLRQAATTSLASTAASNTLPAGAAVGAGLTWAMYRSYGRAPEAIAGALSVATVWNTGVKLLTPLVALLAFAATGGGPGWEVVVASTAVVVGAVAGGRRLLRPGEAQRAAAWADHAVRRVRGRGCPQIRRAGAAADRMRSQTRLLVRDRWARLTVSAVASQAALFVLLLVSLRAVGIPVHEVSLAEAVSAFALVRIALIVPLTPGGAGIAEAGLAGMLSAAGGQAAAVVAAVLVFRAITWLLPIPAGLACYTVWAATQRRGGSAPASVRMT